MKSIKDRVGFQLFSSGETSATAAINQIVAAEEAGIRQIWMNQAYLDPLTILAAAATKTSVVRLGTAIVQTYPRHPLALAQQVLALNDIAPGRLRLGIGPSHSSIIEGNFGLPQRKPLAHLREYVEVLRAVLWEGKVNYHGEFFNVVVPGGLVTSPNTARLPILVSALGEKAFQLAGEIADGALPYLCPVPYLLNTGLPALRKGAAIAGRSASSPPLVAHVLVALTTDHNLAIAAGHQFIDKIPMHLPFYVKMFASAGFPTTLGSAAPDTLVDSLVISGNENTVTARFSELLASGLDELMVTMLPIKDPHNEQFRLMHSIAEL